MKSHTYTNIYVIKPTIIKERGGSTHGPSFEPLQENAHYTHVYIRTRELANIRGRKTPAEVRCGVQ